MLTSVTSGVSFEVWKSPSKIEQAVRVARSVATSTIKIINFPKVIFFIIMLRFVCHLYNKLAVDFVNYYVFTRVRIPNNILT